MMVTLLMTFGHDDGSAYEQTYVGFFEEEVGHGMDDGHVRRSPDLESG